MQRLRGEIRSGLGKREMIRVNCSFCGKSQNEVARLFTGPGPSFICSECVRRLAACLDETPEPPPPAPEPNVRKGPWKPIPHKITKLR
jgi:hypothetical protein